MEGLPISLSPSKATFSAVVRTQLRCRQRRHIMGDESIRFSLSLDEFFHEHSVHLSFLTSMFSSRKFQGHGSEQVHLLPPFALWHFIATSQFEVLVRYHSSSLLGRVGVGIGMEIIHLWGQHEGMLRICNQEHISLPQRLSLLLRNTWFCFYFWSFLLKCCCQCLIFCCLLAALKSCLPPFIFIHKAKPGTIY